MTAIPTGGETALIQPGPLIESMQVELHRELGIDEVFAAIERQQRLELRVDGVDLDMVRDVLDKAGQSSEDGIPSEVLEFLETGAHLTKQASSYAKAGVAALLLGARDRLRQSDRQAWVNGPVAKEWLGKAVILRRPTADVTQQDDNWGKIGPLYGGGKKPYRCGDRAGFEGLMTTLSLDENVTVSVGPTEIKEVFEAVKDPDTRRVTRFIPRVSIEPVGWTPGHSQAVAA
ncbi:MAG TPA: hypothetical protein VFC50_03050 [Candidatus Dormibacteraeota bacterium]|nr:hypothetical protein [Candidatus Dormibacteraeota bacterium]